MTASWSKGRKVRYAYYRCRSNACGAPNIPKNQIETDFVRYLQAMVPKPEYLRLFREIVLDVWKQRHSEAQNTRQSLQRSLDSLLTKKDRIVDAFVHRGVLDQRTYTRQAAQLDEEIALAECALHDARLDELDVEGVLNFAEYFLGNAARLWVEASIEQKQRLQKLLFPSGVTYSRERGFGTAEIAVIFRLLQAVGGQKSREVSPTGFEPVLPT
jgi:site-specific DNA recombinase